MNILEFLLGFFYLKCLVSISWYVFSVEYILIVIYFLTWFFNSIINYNKIIWIAFKFIKTILYEAESNEYEIGQGLRKIKCKTEPTLFQILTPADKPQLSKDQHCLV